MEEINVMEFKRACREELKKWSINDLRTYGRRIGMRCPTKLKKLNLIEEMLGVLCGEIVQTQTKQGAPVKNDYIDQKYVERMKLLKCKYLGEEGMGIEEPKKEELPKETVIVLSEEKLPPKKNLSTATVLLKDGDGKKILSFSFEVKL